MDQGFPFDELTGILERLGFSCRIRGDHHVFSRADIREIMNLQPIGSLAKPYQVKQVRGLFMKAYWGEGMYRYELMVYWSQQDDSFIVEVPELPGCVSDGASYEQAIANAQIVIREWIETARELGRPIPEPRGRRLAFA